MNLYEAIFVRKSVRSYTREEIPEKDLCRIRQYFEELPNLFDHVRTGITIFDNRSDNIRLRTLGAVNAPYYMVFYSEDVPRFQMNIGYCMEQMSLYLCTLGYGSSFVSSLNICKDLTEKGGMQIAGLMAFGIAKESPVRTDREVRRLPEDAVCAFKEEPKGDVREVLRAARFAPSSRNRQPWRFVAYRDTLHIFTRKHKAEDMEKHKQEELDFGIMFANMLIAAEELRVDVDLIRLENISHKQFPNNQYVLSAVMKTG